MCIGDCIVYLRQLVIVNLSSEGHLGNKLSNIHIYIHTYTAVVTPV